MSKFNSLHIFKKYSLLCSLVHTVNYVNVKDMAM